MRRQQKKLQRALETLLAQNLSLKDYTENEVFVIDVADNGVLSITKTKEATTQE